MSARSLLSFEERLARHVEVTASCWLWTGATKGNGYGNVRVQKVSKNAHRWVYEELIGPVSDGLQLDHLCRVRRCVNPDHLEPVAPLVNAARGEKAVKRWCVNGHDLSDPAVCRITPEGRRACRPCRAKMEADRRARLRGA